MKKVLLTVGIGGLVLLTVYAVGRRHGRMKAELGAVTRKQLGDIGKADAQMASIAAAQVRLAETGAALKEYRKAEGLEKFWNPPETEEEAYLKAAYWIAVTSRLARKPELAKAARSTLAGAKRFGVSMRTGATRAIMDEAVATVAPYESVPQVDGVLAILRSQADPERIAARQKQIDDTKFLSTSNMKENAQRSLETVNDGLSFAKGIFTGAKPPYMTPTEWLIKKWGTRVAIALGLYVVGKWYFRGEIHAVKTLASSAGEMYEKAKAQTVHVVGP